MTQPGVSKDGGGAYRRARYNAHMISVIIIAYNEERSIGACLDAFLQKQTDESYELILVDNASTDRTSMIVETYKNRLPLRILREERKGRGAARAAGFKAAQGEIILSSDGDSIVPPRWIENLASTLRNSSAIAVSGPCKVIDATPLTNALFNVIQPLSMHLYRLFVGHYWLTGSNFAIQRSAYEASGGFNPASPSSEDTELSFRVKRIGKIRYVSLAVISSGRRFKGGFFGFVKGLLAYPWTWIVRFIFRKNVDLSDVR